MLIAVFLEEMRDEFFSAALHLIVELALPQRKLVDGQSREMPRVGVGKGPMIVRKMIGQVGADMHLNRLDGIEQQGAKSLVKNTQRPNLGRRSSGPIVIGTRLTKQVQIAGKPEIACGVQPADQLLPVGNEATRQQLIGLFLKGLGRLAYLMALIGSGEFGKKHPPK